MGNVYYKGRANRFAMELTIAEGFMAATIRDITRMTGLALATVSKYLNGGNVLPENRRQIEKAIRELHFEVNEVARGLATSRTKTVGVLIPYLDNIFTASIIADIEVLLRRHGYGTIVCDCRGDSAEEEQELEFLLSKRVDGILAVPTSGSPGYLKKAENRGIPIVLIDRTFENGGYDCILTDNRAASKAAVSALAAYGHRRIGMICGGSEIYTARERLGGYMDGLREGGAAFNPSYVMRNDLSVQGGYDGMKRLLSLPEKPTAVFLANYEITLGAIVALNELGLRFPDDISVVGFDNLMLSQVVKPKLWMVVQPMQEIAQTAAEVMLGRLEGSLKSPAEVHWLKTTLLEGDSIGKI